MGSNFLLEDDMFGVSALSERHTESAASLLQYCYHFAKLILKLKKNFQVLGNEYIIFDIFDIIVLPSFKASGSIIKHLKNVQRIHM